jgi:predicted neuraminidase
MRFLFISVALGWLAAIDWTTRQVSTPVVMKEFIADPSPTLQCHASTIVDTRSGLVAAWFGGTYERHPDVGIWVSRRVGGRWTAPVEAADGLQADGKRDPAWNPVLFQPGNGPLMLFYKVGPTPASWWGMLRTSFDDGKTWSTARRLPDGILGPIKNKPLELAGGEILCPSSSEGGGWSVHFEHTGDLGVTWRATGPLRDARAVQAIQPTLLRHRDGRLQALVRTQQGRVFTADSADGGKSWSVLRPLDLPNPNSGVDAVTLADGRFLLVYNHARGAADRWDAGRGVLNVATSTNGRDWQPALVLEDEAGQEFSYPAVIQARDGTVHITYTWKRIRIRHVVLDPGKL